MSHFVQSFEIKAPYSQAYPTLPKLVVCTTLGTGNIQTAECFEKTVIPVNDGTADSSRAQPEHPAIIFRSLL